MAARIVNLLVGPDADGMRLDAFLAAGAGMPSRSECARLMEGGPVTINETPATPPPHHVPLDHHV
ncbi:RNA-binding S4 domain-containing protein, partial [Thermophilibacter sp.]